MGGCMEQLKKTAAIVLAAGQGKRMNSKTAKQYLLLEGRPILYYSLKTFQESCVDHIVLVTGAADKEFVRREIVEKYGFDKVRCIVDGGKERYHSVYNGLQAAGEYLEQDGYVLIHDGARPFVTCGMIENALEVVAKSKACVVGMPVKDTIKISDPMGYAQYTPPRSSVWMVQTPQVFDYDLVAGAYSELIEKEAAFLEQGIQITDDAGVVELLTNVKVRLVEGSYQNIKITTPEDLEVAKVFLEQ